MQELSNKIYNLLKEQEFDDKSTLDELIRVYKDIEDNIWEIIDLNPMTLYSLKDVIWYNLEHLPNGGEEIGVSSLKYLSSRFPEIASFCNESDYILNENVPALLSELEMVKLLWSINWKFVNLYTKSHTGWTYGENPSKIIIHGVDESPQKYGYNTNYGNILDSKGEKIKKLGLETPLCSVHTIIGEYENGQILNFILLDLISICKKALINKKNIKINFTQSEFINYDK